MSFVLLGILNSQASAAAQAYFLSVLGGADNENAESVIFDSENNIFCFGSTQSVGQGSSDFLLAKYDSLGSIQWQRILGGAGADNGKSVSVDSANNVYVFGQSNSTGSGSADFLLAKYNSSGTIAWQRILDSTDTDDGKAVATDSQDNVYVFGDSFAVGSAGRSDFLLAKYNSSGTIQWQRLLGGVEFETGNGVAIDSQDNVYVCGSTDSTGQGGQEFLIAKYNSSGTIQWQRILGGAGFDIPKAVATDSQDNVYVFGNTASTGAGSGDFLLAKYNSSGTIQWQRILGGGSNEPGNAVAVDSEDNLYVFGHTVSTGAGGFDFLFAKYDSAGTIQWQRILGGANFDTGSSVAVDLLDDLCLLGNTESTGAGGNDFLLAKLPNDGSLEGTYSLDGNNIVYQASSLTAATASLTSATSSLTSSSASLTSSTSSLTDASASLTSVTLDITP